MSGSPRYHSASSLWIVSAALLAMAALFVSLPSAVAQEANDGLGPNLALNSSFDRGTQLPSGWNWGTTADCDAGASLDEAVRHEGHRSVRLQRATPFAPNSYGGLSTLVVGVTPGTEYVIRLWAKGKGVGAVWFGGGPNWTVRQSFPQGDFDWQQGELHWVAPARVGAFELRISVDSPTEALWVTDVTFQAVAGAPGATSAPPTPTPVQPYVYDPYVYVPAYPGYVSGWPEWDVYPWDPGPYWGLRVDLGFGGHGDRGYRGGGSRDGRGDGGGWHDGGPGGRGGGGRNDGPGVPGGGGGGTPHRGGGGSHDGGSGGGAQHGGGGSHGDRDSGAGAGAGSGAGAPRPR